MKEKKNTLPLLAALAAFLLASVVFITGMVFVSCPNNNENSAAPQVTITFNIGYEGGVSPAPVTLNKGSSGGSGWPRNPSRAPYRFLGWFDGDTKYDRDTVINGNVTLTAKWEELGSLDDQPDSSDIAALFDTGNGFPEKLSDARKIWGMNNPTVTFAFVADPVPMVYCPNIENSGATEGHSCDECTLYVYGSNDTLAFNGNTQITGDNNFDKVIQGLRVVSTKDLVNWTDHGIINLTAKNSTNPLFDGATEKVAPYASDTWAPSAQWRKEGGKPRFYLYWCNQGSNTSVVVSDVSPIGPFYNPGLTASMVNKDMSGFGTVENLFDPGTIIDSNGTAYMVLGGGGNTANPGNVRIVQMNSNMTSIVGNGPTLNLPWHFEATDIWKWRKKYYITYTTNWGNSKPSGWNDIDVAYTMNYDGPREPFPDQLNSSATPNPSMVNKLLPNGSYGDNTNHSSLFDFKNKPYLIYHTSSACAAFGADRLRTAHLVDIVVNSNGTLGSTDPETQKDTKVAAMGVRGVAQVLDKAGGGFNPYNVVEAETMAVEGGVYTKGKGNQDAGNGISVASIDTGDWLGLYGVDFDKKSGGATKFNVIVKMPVTAEGEEYTGAIEIRLDPQQQGLTYLDNSSTLGTGPNGQSRITGGTVVGYVQLKVKDKEDEGKWALVSADLNQTVTGKHNLAFVFYSSRGDALERFTSGPTTSNDGRRRDVGFEIDQWWFE